MKRSLAVSVFLSLSARTLDVAAQDPVEVRPIDPGALPTAPAPVGGPEAPPAGNVRLALGYRHAVIADRGFDTFATDDRLSQLSLETSYAPVNGRTGALAAGVSWDFGSRGADTDGLSARINVHRFTLPLEGRVYLSSWAYAFSRVAPGVATYQVRITNLATPLSGSPWVLAADSSAGVSVLLGPHGARAGDVARVWFTPEVGYGWTDASAIRLTSERGPIIVAEAPERLPELALRGVFFRAQIGFTL